jgi:hypothetical protein
MISIEATVVTTRGTAKPTPTIHLRADELNAEVLHDLLAVLAERAGAMSGVGLLAARIEPHGGGTFRFSVSTEVETAMTEPLAISSDTIASAGYPVDGSSFRYSVRPHRLNAIDILDLHLPVFSGRRVDEERLEPASPYIYGTAFPLWHGGLFATAAHVLDSARADGEVVLGRLKGEGPIPGYGVEQAEVYPQYDFALLKCPSLEKFPPVALEMRRPLSLFDDVSAVGYPFSVDPEHLIATHRGFAGHVVAFRQLFQLPGQPLGYELSFQTPPGMSGAPLMHRDEDGVNRCYGFVVQQMDVEFSGVSVRLGLAVSATILRAIQSRFLKDRVVSEWFGIERHPQPPQRPRRTPDLSSRHLSSLEDWPDGE